MVKIFAFAVATTMSTLLNPAQAMQIQSIAPGSQITLVRDGCGPWFHRGYDGECHPDRRYERPDQGYDRPDQGYDHPYRRYGEEDPGVQAYRCPPGYHLGRYSGVCKPNEGY